MMMRTVRSRANWLASALLLSVAPIGLAASPAALAAPAASGDVITPPQVAAVAARVAAAAQAEVADKQIPSIAIALVDRSGVVWQQAWGDAGAADSLYRA